jgi:enoyl-CoA hydratase
LSYKYIIYQKEGALAKITFNRPEVRNALNFAAIDETLSAAQNAASDESIRVVILTGSGEKAFVAGADVAEMNERDTVTELGERSNRRRVLSGLLESMPKPTIAAVNGYAIGTGMELAMACNIRIASENAKFGQTEINLGIIPGNGGTQRLARLVGEGRAMELVLAGEIIDVQEAYRIGLVNHVVPLAELMAYVRNLAEKLAAKSPLALRLAKDAIHQGLGMSLADGLAYEQTLYAISHGSADKKEGVTAFLEKRKPDFSGR